MIEKKEKSVENTDNSACSTEKNNSKSSFCNGSNYSNESENVHSQLQSLLVSLQASMFQTIKIMDKCQSVGIKYIGNNQNGFYLNLVQEDFNFFINNTHYLNTYNNLSN